MINIKSTTITRTQFFIKTGFFCLCLIAFTSCSKEEIKICDDTSLVPELTRPLIDDIPAKCTIVRWKYQPTVTDYLLQICRCEDFDKNDVSFYETEVSKANYHNFSFDRNGTFYFRIKAIDDDCESDWSLPTSYEPYTLSEYDLCSGELVEEFTKPELIFPEDQEILPNDFVDFKWQFIYPADYYDIEIREVLDLGFTVIYEKRVFKNERSIQRFSSGSYSWRVRAGDSEEETLTSWSDVWYFEIR